MAEEFDIYEASVFYLFVTFFISGKLVSVTKEALIDCNAYSASFNYYFYSFNSLSNKASSSSSF